LSSSSSFLAPSPPALNCIAHPQEPCALPFSPGKATFFLDYCITCQALLGSGWGEKKEKLQRKFATETELQL
jgi:hypothetical protein